MGDIVPTKVSGAGTGKADIAACADEGVASRK
jgi:hypothetical protein